MYDKVMVLMSELMLRSNDLVSHIESSNRVAFWSLDGLELKTLIETSTDIHCDHSLKGSSTKQNVGVVSIDQEGLEIIDDINRIKVDLKEILTNHGNRKEGKKTVLEVSKSLYQESFGRKVVRTIGESDVSLLQIYRLYPCFNKPVEHISYTWVRSNRSMKRIGYKECLDLICKKVRDEDNKITYIDIIKRRPESLLVVKPVSEHLKANIKFKDGSRKSIMAHSPIFVLIGKEGLPVIKWCGGIDTFSERIIRSDKRISDIPAIPELNIYFSE